MEKMEKKQKTTELNNFVGFAIGILISMIIAIVVYLSLPNWYGLE